MTSSILNCIRRRLRCTLAARSTPQPAQSHHRFIFRRLLNAATDGSFPTGFNYTRSDNPNRAALEQALAAVEGGAVAAAFASGVAAAMARLPDALA